MSVVAFCGWACCVVVTLGAYLANTPEPSVKWTPSRGWISEREVERGMEFASWTLNGNYYQLEVGEMHTVDGSTFIVSINTANFSHTVGRYSTLASALRRSEKLLEILDSEHLQD